MKSSDKKESAIGLDVGTSRIVTARSSGEGFEFQEQLNAFVNLPYSKVTESVLKKERVPHTVAGADIVVQGNESARFADLLGVETRRPMNRGFLNPQEPEGLNRMAHLIRTLCGEAKHESDLVYFSVPAAPPGEQENLTYHEAALKQVLNDLGYRAKSITEGLAVVYSELEASNYTGIGVSCGGGLCNVCLSYLSVPVFSFSISKAGDFIDSSSASVTGDLATRVRFAKEEGFHFNGHFVDKTHQALTVYYEDMMCTLVDGLKDQLAKCRQLPKLGRAVPLVLSGGSSMPPGFRDRFEKMLTEANLPTAISEIRLAQSPLHSTAKGALVAALIDE